jgi:2-methylisocitrate lyase-like PEP mutase family enzyme
MPTQTEKAATFRELHAQPGAFIIPNPWDAGTARLLATIGFKALATTSLGLANTLGRADSHVTRDEVIANCRLIVEATDLPVNADLENGFADEPEAAAEAIRLAAEGRRGRRLDRGLHRQPGEAVLRFRLRRCSRARSS